MFNFKTVSIIYLVCTSMLLVLDWTCLDMSVWIYFIPFLIYFIIITWGSFYVNSNFYVETVGRFTTDKKEVVITFDDGPHEEMTIEILNILKQEQVKVAFFCIGSKIAKAADTIRRIHKEGHEIGLHSYSHSYVYDFYPASCVIKDLKKNQTIIQDLIGHNPLFFRPPYGVTNPAIGKAVRKSQLKVVGWSIRSLDTVIKNEDKILSRLFHSTKPGSIILLHDHLKSTPNILRRYISYLKHKGYRVIKLSEAIQEKPYA